MNLADIRSRLDGLEGRAFWRSLEELADTPDFREYVHREFPSQASEFTDPAGRRQFLKLMGASLALAGVSACTRQPQETIVPYVTQPEEIVPGRPLFFATAMELGGLAQPLLAESHMGRPTKLEGNPEHPVSLGGTDIHGQTSVLGLYDPDRSRTVLNQGTPTTWSLFLAALQGVTTAQTALGGASLRILTEPISSPSVLDQLEMLMSSMPDAKWHQWDPVFGTWQGGAPAAAPVYRFDRADVIVSLDADFLGAGAGSVRYAKDFSSRRRITTPQAEQNRLYVVEPVPTVTGAKADHRLALKAREVGAFASALGAAMGVGPASGELPDEARTRWIPAVAADLQAHRGRSVVVAGPHQPAAVHALARAMNDALGNTGETVHYMAPVTASPADGTASIAELVREMNAGQVEVVVVIGSNPVFTAPADLGFAEAFAKVPTRIHMGLYHDETAELCHWHVPQAHFLEAWGDVRAFDGTVSLQQPLIAPLYDGHAPIEVFSALNSAPGATSAEIVKEYWTRAFAGETTTSWPLVDRNGQKFATFDAFWRHALHDGFLWGTSVLAGAAAAPAPAEAPVAAPAPMTGTEVVFRPDPLVLDGRFANNGWLQELPKPISKVTWDAVAYVSLGTAESLGLDTTRVGNGDVNVIEIAVQDRTLRMPVWILPGTADDTVVVHFGYGRRRAGRVGTDVGTDAFPLRTSLTPWFAGGATVTRTDDTYPIASTQNHFSMEGRHPVRVVDAEEYRSNPESVAELGHHRPPPEMSLYPPYEYNGHKWGMAIDLNACTGCGVCVAACVAENNIPVVGKSQVMRSREMHWIRVDTYFEGDPHQPAGTYHQPVPCQQCENAPCEVVCPVAATVHSDEGLNDMVYNRCVGTRYCSNNCPYKVRRFNFMLYSDFTTQELRAQRNPDVTIRSRGVMEKCTYCVQRINHARIDAKTAGTPIPDGTIQTACEQACPADAIVFGDLNQADSRVVALKAQQRNYGLLEETGTRPRTTYLAVVRNPNPALG
ncbi:MAG: TAT-variant-translocated molybdopterin oxidoreductase [Vicinamibacterales bacterium]